MDCSMSGFPVHHRLPEPIQLMSITLVMPSNHLILCCPLLLPSSIFLSIRVFSNEFVLLIRWSFSQSVQFSCSVVSDSFQPHALQQARPPCPSPTPGVHPNPCPLSHPTISSSVVPFSSCPQSFPASGSFRQRQISCDITYMRNLKYDTEELIYATKTDSQT